jgi:hypothetical protein
VISVGYNLSCPECSSIENEFSMVCQIEDDTGDTITFYGFFCEDCNVRFMVEGNTQLAATYGRPKVSPQHPAAPRKKHPLYD